MKTRKLLTIIVLLLAAVFALSACDGGAATPVPSGDDEPAEPADDSGDAEDEPMEEGLSGDVVVDGSSTVYPVTTAVAEEFAGDHPDVRVSVGLSGTGGGFKKFCPGETDISDASRPIKDEEAADCEANGIEWTEFLVALDGLTVMVNPANDWLDELTQAQLGALFEADSEVTTWADLDPSFPEEEILFFIPDPDSGTRDYMTEVVEEITGAEDLRQDENTTFSSDDNVLLDGIANEQYGIGFFGYAYYAANTDAVKAVAVENSAGNFVLPSDETVQNGSYNPLSRPLFIYTNNESMRTKEQVAEFVTFYFAAGAETVMPDVGYSLPPEGTYDVNLELIDAILSGQNPVGTRDAMGMGEAEEEEASASTLSGDVVVDGSSTVYPVTVAVAEEFAGIHPDVRVSVGLSGTGGGFKKFCPGETDISDASRPIKDEEAAECEANGIEWSEFVVALDGLTVMVNPENDWLDQLTQEQLGALFMADSEITLWSDLDPSYPAEEILFFIPDPDSGTRDYMIEVVEDINGAEDLRQDENTTFSSDDNVLLDGIANEQYAIGFFGYAYYAANTDTVKAVAIENDAGEFVLPGNETVQDGSYNPLARPIFIYTNNESMRTKPQVAEFVTFYFTADAGAEAIMADVGYTLPPEGTYEANLATIEEILAE